MISPLLVVRNITTKLTGVPLDVLPKLDDALAVEVPNAYWTYAYKKGLWDGKVHFFSQLTGSFLTGFVPEVALLLDEFGYSVKIKDERRRPKLGVYSVRGELVLRDYQEMLVQAALKQSRGVIKAATNAGKTEIAMEIIKHLGLRTLYLVHTLDLREQTVRRLRARFELPIGLIGGTIFDPQLITVAMVQTLTKKLKHPAMLAYLNSVDVLIADEVHRMTADTWKKVMRRVNAFYRFGMSGTPLQDGAARDRLLIGLTGQLFPSISNLFLVEHGFSARPVIRFVSYFGTLRKIRWDAGAYRVMIVEHPGRTVATVELCRRHRKEQVLLLVNWVEHGRRLLQAIRAIGIQTYILTGRDLIEDRVKMLGAFKRREFQVLIATTIFDEGMDIPEIDVLIMAGALGMSPVKPLQRLGRGLRKRPDKDEVLIYDFYDCYQEHTAEHTENRIKLFRDEGLDVRIEKKHLS